MKTRTMLGALAVGCGVALAVTAGGDGGDAADWPSWRGPRHDGLAPGGKPPLTWSETENVRWKVELPGPGHATPIVWGDRLFVLSAVETERTVEPEAAPGEEPAEEAGRAALVAPARYVAGPQEAEQPPAPQPRGRRGPPPAPTRVLQFVVSAHDRATGATIWKTVVREEVPHEAGHVTGSQASASPVTDGERVYASFGSRGIYALDLDGKVLWKADLGDMTTRNQFGEGSSPALHGDTLIVNWDHEGDSFIAALDNRTGVERWRAARDEPTSWSTPLVVQDGGRALAVVSATNRTRAYDVGTGAEIWSCGGLGLNCIPSPVVQDDLVFVMSGYREAAGMAIRYPGARGDLTDGDRVAWRLEDGLSYVSSPLLYDGKLYMLEKLQAMLSCVDMKTGRAHYTKQRLEGLGNIYASLVGADGRIYVVDREGNAVVLKHGETFEELARNKLQDQFDASPIIVGDVLYLRGHKHLYSLSSS